MDKKSNKLHKNIWHILDNIFYIISHVFFLIAIAYYAPKDYEAAYYIILVAYAIATTQSSIWQYYVRKLLKIYQKHGMSHHKNEIS